MTAPICPQHKVPLGDCFREHYPHAFRHPEGYDADCGDGAALKAAVAYIESRDHG